MSVTIQRSSCVCDDAQISASRVDVFSTSDANNSVTSSVMLTGIDVMPIQTPAQTSPEVLADSEGQVPRKRRTGQRECPAVPFSGSLDARRMTDAVKPVVQHTFRSGQNVQFSFWTSTVHSISMT